MCPDGAFPRRVWRGDPGGRKAELAKNKTRARLDDAAGGLSRRVQRRMRAKCRFCFDKRLLEGRPLGPKSTLHFST